MAPAFQQLGPSLDKEKPEQQQVDTELRPASRTVGGRGSKSRHLVFSGFVQNLPIPELFL